MFAVVNCIVDQHNLWLVLLAALICVTGSWAVIRLYRRGRLASGAEAIGWQFLAATAAGASIWATHFIAMIAYQPGAPVTFDPVLTIISLLVAMVGSFCGFIVAGMIRAPWAPSIGGGMIGLSVAIMHYTGMFAYVAGGFVEWNLPYVISSVILAVVLTGFAIHVASRNYRIDSKLVAICLLTLAIVSLHFTGMTAYTLVPASVYQGYTNPAAMQAMALAVGLVSLMIIGAVLSSYLIDSQTRTRSLSQLQRMALTDALTSLANRAAYADHLDACIERANRGGKKFALAAIDLDRFKEINDLRGHSAGDETLKTLAERMRSFNDGNMFIARIGGDEFSVIIDCSDRAGLRENLARLRLELVKPFHFDDIELSVGASIGACIYPDDAQTRDALINNTDLALYRAKTEIADKICFYDTVMDEAVRDRRELASDLRHAIENNELDIYYQVQTAVPDGSISGYEALLRWKHPDRGYIPPMEFIPLAEENGLIMQLGEWVLRTACIQCASQENMRVAVNVSPLQFLHKNLPGLVADILKETGMKAENLELELTESAIIQDKQRTLLQLQQIRKLGVSIALDDFGTGYSSLDTLRAFPFDKIKLDRSFMDEVDTSDQSRAILRAVLALGKSLEIPVLAEGIETAEQLAILHEEGCETAQGYYFGRPAPLGKIVEGTSTAAIIADEADVIRSAAA